MKSNSDFKILILVILLIVCFFRCHNGENPKTATGKSVSIGGCIELKADLNETQVDYHTVYSQMQNLNNYFIVDNDKFFISDSILYSSISSVFATIKPDPSQCQNGYIKGLRIEFGWNNKVKQPVLIYEPVILYLRKSHHHLFSINEQNAFYTIQAQKLVPLDFNPANNFIKYYQRNLQVSVNGKLQAYDPYRDLSGILFTSQEIDTLDSDNLITSANPNGVISSDPLKNKIYIIGGANEDRNSGGIFEQNIIISPIRIDPTIEKSLMMPLYTNVSADFGNGCKPVCAEVVIPITNQK